MEAFKFNNLVYIPITKHASTSYRHLFRDILNWQEIQSDEIDWNSDYVFAHLLHTYKRHLKGITECVKKYNLKPLARVVSVAASGVEPAYMGIGPVSATLKALKRADISINDIGLAELNEAFASQSLACIRDLGLNPEIVNVNGGAIAIGHPLGCSGARITGTLLHEMKRRPNVKYGLATMCIGVGQGMAIIYERC